MKLKLKYAMLGLAISVAVCAAYFSVLGLSQLFSGASTAVIIMASVLEISKLVTTTALHTYWEKLAKPLRIYLSISVVILMLITSAGIYGFLSNAYQLTANQLEIHEGELGVLDAKKVGFEKTVSDNQKLIDSKTKRLDQLSNLRTTQESRLDNSGSNRARNSVRNDIKSADSEIQKLNTEIDVLNLKNITLADSINKYNVKAIEMKAGSAVAAEVGPLKYISQLTGVSMDSIVNYLILLLVFVFDPLAVALVLITNRVFQLESDEIKKDSTQQVLEDIVEELTNKSEEVVQNQPILDNTEINIVEPTIEKSNNMVFEEPIEYSDDETIEQPIFENIIDPIDDVIDEEEIDKVEVVKETIEKPIQPIEEVVEETIEKPIQSIEEVVEENIETSIEEEKVYEPKGKITLDDIKEVKERNRGFSVKVPEPKKNNMIQRINKR